MLPQFDDQPIFALATPPGRGAIHVQRVSGKGVLQSLQPLVWHPVENRLLRSEEWLPKDGSGPRTRYLRLGRGVEQWVDDVVVSVWRGPKSYTGEDVVEISSHGNEYVLSAVQSLLRTVGFRDAQPGEFSLRAFWNGRIDLLQAEGLQALLAAESAGAVTQARQVLSGHLSHLVADVRERIISVRAILEAHIDFDETDVGTCSVVDLQTQLVGVREVLLSLLSGFVTGKKIREGLRVGIFGRPNAGKSTLFNGLLRSERALVSEIPGTTRDVLEERLTLSQKDFVLVDTAGVREATDPIERMGVERARAVWASVDLALVVVDGSWVAQLTNPEIMLDREIFRLGGILGDENVPPIILVLTKSDAMTDAMRDDLENMLRVFASRRKLIGGCFSGLANFSGVVDGLSVAYEGLLADRNSIPSALLISARQRDLVATALKRVDESRDVLVGGGYLEVVASILLQVNEILSEIIGDVAPDDVLDALFGSFCIGK